MWKPSLEKRSGVRFESGKMYVIGGTVNGARFASRHVASGSPSVYVCLEDGARVVPGQTCTLLVDTLEERRRFVVLLGRSGPVVRPTRALLEGFGIPTGESTVVELAVRKPGDAGARKVYSRWDPLLGFMEFPLAGTGFAVGDLVEVVGGRKYDVGAFVESFRAHKLGELANVELGLEGGSLTAVMDGRQIPVERHWLTTHGLKAALKVELGYNHRMVKFVFDGSSVEARFGNSDPILEWSAVGGGVDVRYSRGAGQAYVMRMEQRPIPKAFQTFDWLAAGIRVIEGPNVPQGRYLLEMSEGVREMTRQKLNAAGGGATYRRLRGDIGEGIVRVLLEDMRMKLLYDHPLSDLGARYGSRQEGPDLMVECMNSAVVVYLEVKWWEDFIRAFGEAKKQAIEYFRTFRFLKGRNITGAYIAVLNWKLTESAKLWVERVA